MKKFEQYDALTLQNCTMRTAKKAKIYHLRSVEMGNAEAKKCSISAYF